MQAPAAGRRAHGAPCPAPTRPAPRPHARSLIYPGYSFYYDNRGLTWGGFYCGDGLRNFDLVFML
jgi:hypothetical protein